MIEGKAKPSTSPMWLGYRSYSGTFDIDKSFYVILPKSVLDRKPSSIRVRVEWDED